MEALLASLAQHSGQILLVLASLLLVVILMVTHLMRRQKRVEVRWRELLAGPTGLDLEGLLNEHLSARRQLEAQVAALKKRVEGLEEELGVSKRHVGVVRYDAFEDVSGQQSFALALYDDQGNGAVISSIVGRAECRVYCKPLLSGRSERNLSQEEQRAIREALTSGVKSIVSP